MSVFYLFVKPPFSYKCCVPGVFWFSLSPPSLTSFQWRSSTPVFNVISGLLLRAHLWRIFIINLSESASAVGQIQVLLKPLPPEQICWSSLWDNITAAGVQFRNTTLRVKSHSGVWGYRFTPEHKANTNKHVTVSWTNHQWKLGVTGLFCLLLKW